MKKIVIVLIWISTILITGCTNLVCKPDWVRLEYNTEEPYICKTRCLENFGVTSYRTNRLYFGEYGVAYECYCDANDCGCKDDCPLHSPEDAPVIP